MDLHALSIGRSFCCDRGRGWGLLFKGAAATAGEDGGGGGGGEGVEGGGGVFGRGVWGGGRGELVVEGME